MPLPYLRHQRVAELIHRELGQLMLREIDFKGALVTITEVEVTPKLDFARIGISILPASKEKEVMKILVQEHFRLQKELLYKINIKPMPKLGFEIDRGAEGAARVEKAFIDHPLPPEASAE